MSNNTSRSRPTIGIAWAYVLAALVILFLCVLTIIALSITRPSLDVMVVSAVVFAFGSTMFTAMAAAIKTQEVNHKVTEVGYRVDGKLKQLIDETEKRAKMEGQVQGMAAATGTIPPTPALPSPPATTITSPLDVPPS